MSKITKDEIISNLNYLGIKKGNFPKFLMEYENLTFPEALKQLAERAGVELPEEDEDGDTDE